MYLLWKDMAGNDKSIIVVILGKDRRKSDRGELYINLFNYIYSILFLAIRVFGYYFFCILKVQPLYHTVHMFGKQASEWRIKWLYPRIVFWKVCSSHIHIKSDQLFFLLFNKSLLSFNTNKNYKFQK